MSGEPDARLDDLHRHRDVLEIFVEAANFACAQPPSRKARLDADDRAYERDRVGRGAFRRICDGEHLGVAGRIAKVQTMQRKSK